MKLILASNRLPVRVTAGPTGPVVEPSDGGLATAVGRAARRLKPRWVGSLGSDSTAEDIAAMAEHNFLSVALGPSLYKRYYTGYSNRVLWPLLNGFNAILAPSTYWADYVQANRVFAERIAAIIEPEDVVWVHDYHLFLLPEMLRGKGIKNKIGFFLHTPFPDVPFFRETAAGRRIVRSLELCDSVGVQTSSSLANLTAAARSIAAGVFPIGIDYRQFARRLNPAPVFMERIPAKKRTATILSLSRLDYIKGLPQLLEGVSRLADDPSLTRRFKLRLVVVPSREQQREYQILRQQLEKAAAAINEKAGNDRGPLVEFEYGFLSPDQCIAAYRGADIFVASSISEGMNLVAKEYIAANPTGTLVLGRGAGAAERLQESILVDGTDPESIAAGLKTALVQPPAAEQRRRLRRIVRTENVYAWATGFLSSLET